MARAKKNPFKKESTLRVTLDIEDDEDNDVCKRMKIDARMRRGRMYG